MKKKSFALGYSYVVHSLLMYWIYGVAASTGMQYTAPAYAAAHSLDYSTLMGWNTVGAFASCLFTIFMGKLIVKKGVRLVTTISLLLAGAFGMLILNFTTGYFGWAFASIFTQGLTQGYCFGATNTLITNWYPKKKGFVMGITTCGIMLAGMTYIPIMSKMTIGGMVTLIGVTFLVLGVLTWFWVRNTPEECGLYPDNQKPTDAELANTAAMKAKMAAFKSAWTWKDLFARKEAWFILFFGGIGLLATTGSAVSGRPFWLELGFSDSSYLIFMQFSSAACIAGSLITGAIDSKWGPRVSSLVYAIVAAIAFGLAPLLWLLGMTPPAWLVMATMLCASAMLGATSNLIPSLVASVFGRMDFAECFRKIYMGCFLLRSLCYLAVGPGVKILGSYANLRLFFGVLFVICTILVLFVNDKKLLKAPNATEDPYL